MPPQGKLIERERLRFPRYPVRIPITLVSSEADVVSVHGHTADVSQCGLCVVTEVDLRHGGDQQVLIETAAGLLVARADVLRCEQRGSQWVHGLFITQIDDVGARLLDRLCQEGA